METLKQKINRYFGQENESLIGSMLLWGFTNEEFNWNINTKIDNMSYLERMKEGQQRTIEYAEKQIETAKATLEKLEHIVHPTNKELYQSLSSWDIVNIGKCFKITVPKNVLLSPEQEDIVRQYVRVTHDQRDEYGGAASIDVEVDRVKVI